MLNYFRGCWKLFREIRSLADKHYIGIVNEAVASFHPWSHNINPGDSSANIAAGERTNEQWLLYRESGKLENFDFPDASGQFTRQYLYKFPQLNRDPKNHLKVFHCSKSTLKQEDLDPLNSHFDPTAFNEADFFHDLIFPENVNWESLCLKVTESLPVKGSKESMTIKTDKESVTVMGKEPLTAVGQHLCGRDIYKGVFQVYSVDNFKTVWKVTGPEKAFQIVSIYTRFS